MRTARNPLNDPSVRGWMLQLLLISALVLGFGFLAENAVRNLTSRHIPFGFAFLFQSAGFDIEQRLIDYNPLDSVSRVILVGLTNTVVAAVTSVVCASVLGLVIAMMRLSPNLLFRATGLAYVGLIRNIPLLLLVFFSYSAVLRLLPSPHASWTIGASVFLNVRGLYLPRPIVTTAGMFWTGLSIVIASIAVLLAATRHLSVWSRYAVLAICLGSSLLTIAAVARQVPVGFEYPRLAGFNFRGGLHLFPEFVALVAALSVGEAAFIAEIIRAGVLSVGHGQTEAARALGMSRLQIIRKIVFPQALPVIIPPLTSEYLSLTKATSLGVAIAFPDLVQVFAGIVLSRAGHEIEVMLITMLIYLSLSLLTAAFMNWYNRRAKLVEG